MLQGAAIVTGLELLVGLVVNRWLGWGRVGLLGHALQPLGAGMPAVFGGVVRG